VGRYHARICLCWKGIDSLRTSLACSYRLCLDRNSADNAARYIYHQNQDANTPYMFLICTSHQCQGTNKYRTCPVCTCHLCLGTDTNYMLLTYIGHLEDLNRTSPCTQSTHIFLRHLMNTICNCHQLCFCHMCPARTCPSHCCNI